jgi:hypothetical protein
VIGALIWWGGWALIRYDHGNTMLGAQRRLKATRSGFRDGTKGSSSGA